MYQSDKMIFKANKMFHEEVNRGEITDKVFEHSAILLNNNECNLFLKRKVDKDQSEI